MTLRTSFACFCVFAVIAVGSSGGRSAAQNPVAPQETRLAVPRFDVDRSWPRLPPKWKVGEVASVAIDDRDHVWVLHRPRSLSGDDRALAAPPVLEFDSRGNFIQAWGGEGQGYEWPQREHGIFVDHRRHVWIGGNNARERNLPGFKPVNDDQVLKFNAEGKFLLQIGRSNQSRGNNDTRNLHQPADVFVYRKTNEAFVADGYGNQRIIVFDANSGAFKRMWGAFGYPPDAPGQPAESNTPQGASSFNTVHAVRVSRDGLVYVADRGNKRIQVFTVDGAFVKQVLVAPQTVGLTARAVAFSADPKERFLYVAGQPEIWVLDRMTLQNLGAVAQPNAHHFAVDSQGNIYTAETEQHRSRRFILVSQ